MLSRGARQELVILSAVCAPVARHGTVLLGAVLPVLISQHTSWRHAHSPPLSAGDISWERGSTEPSPQELALGIFCRIKQFVFVPLSRWSPGSHTPRSAHSGLQPAGTDPESRGCDGIISGHCPPRSYLQYLNCLMRFCTNSSLGECFTHV